MKIKMERIPVSSSNIASIGYETDSQTLEVEFNNGTIYQYYDVPEHIYDELLSSSSVGSYFNQQVKSNYSYSQV